MLVLKNLLIIYLKKNRKTKKYKQKQKNMKNLYFIILLLFSSIHLFGQTNDVFFFLTEAGGPPVTLSGATISLTDGGAYNQSITSGDPIGDVFTAVPYGSYTYNITKDCYITISGSVTVDLNGGTGISVFESMSSMTTANVFWNVNETSSPMSFPVATAAITMTDGANTYSIT